jgi:hypothetical protein
LHSYLILVSVDAKPPLLLLILKNFLSPEGATWGVGESVTRNTVENLDQLLKLPKKKISLFLYLHTTISNMIKLALKVH